MKIIKRWIQLDPNNSDALTSQNIPYVLNNTTTIYDKLQQIEGDYVKKIGDTMTGDLTMSSSSIIVSDNNDFYIQQSPDYARGLRFKRGTTSLYRLDLVFNSSTYLDLYTSSQNFHFHSHIMIDGSNDKGLKFYGSGSYFYKNGLLMKDGPIIIGSSGNRNNGDKLLEFTGSTSSAFLSVQDGNGRIQLKWNATYGTSETFLVGSENAGRYIFNPATQNNKLFSIDFADGSSADAGDSITWINVLNIGTNEFTYLSYNVWHEGNDGSGSGLDADTTDGKHILEISQATYDSLSSKDPDTLYVITS